MKLSDIYHCSIAYYIAMTENPMVTNEAELSSYENTQILLKKELPEYVVNIFIASGYDRLESIAKINDQTIDEMIAYTNKTFDGDCLRYIHYICSL